MIEIAHSIESVLLPGLAVVLVFLLLILNKWLFRKMETVRSSISIFRRSISFIIILMGLILFIMALPIDKALKGQILSFFGIIISAGIALSSTTLLGNLMAGFMNSSISRFKNGDLINIGDFMGRVTRKRAFHTEIQLEDSNFLAVPNLYIASNPVKITRKTNDSLDH